MNTDITLDITTTKKLADTVQKLSMTTNIREIMQIVRTVARDLTGADGTTFVLRDENLCYYADEDAIAPLWKGSRFPMENCISGWAMINKRPAVIKDIYEDERIPHDIYRKTFVKSLVVVPIRTMDPLGAIGNYWANQHQPTDQEITILRALADITAVSIENIEVRNELQKKLKERTAMLEQLKKQQKQLQEFTYIIAHNMRAPMSNLLLLADMVKKNEDIDRKLLLMDKQLPIINHLHQTFEELVDAIQVKADFSIEYDYIELDGCFEKNISLLKGEVIKSDATVEADFSAAKTVYFPRKYMDSILFNLLSNALKYRNPQTPPRICVRSFKKEGWTWLEVEDNGLGIDLNKHADKIFKLRQTFHEHPNAKGYGLFMVKTQVDATGGEISLESTPNKGSVFTIKLSENKQ